jgi:hypothetical protein
MALALALPQHPRGIFVVIAAIVIITMSRVTLDSYVIDVLLPDLVGHDRRPAAFLVYLFLLRHSAQGRGGAISVSLQTIATKTGLSKSSVQAALRHLKRRQLLDPAVVATRDDPVRKVLRPWDKHPSTAA